jgi:Arc/MetJ-type ribon-helix-helix transcriptional regulator
MPRYSVTLPEEHAELIEDLAGDDGPAGSKSEAVRMLIDDAHRVDDLEAENERLRRERRQLLEQREEHNDLVRYADEQRARERRQREKEEQPVWTRAKWWVLGRPPDQHG